MDVLKNLKPKELEIIKDKSDYNDNEMHLKYKEVFNKLSNEKIGETCNISNKINFDSLTYHFKGSSTAKIRFIDVRGQIHIYNKIQKW